MTIAAPRPLRTTRPRRTPTGGGTANHASDYTELTRRVKAAGLLDRRPRFYAVRGILLVAAFTLATVLMLAVGRSWWQLAVAVLFGVLFTQVGFLAHDGAHRQMFVSGKRNEWVSRVLANLVVGLSYGWWMHKHSRHHANPNTQGKDLDMDASALVFTPRDAATRTGFAKVLMRKQGWFFFPVLTLTGLDLHVKSIAMLTARGEVKHRFVELAFIALRLVGFATLAIVVAGPVIGPLFLLVQVLVFGFTMGSAFAPNHKGMPLIDESQRVDYLRRQVLTSRNIAGGWPVTLGMGGLNYQIEHHLFPNMPSINLHRARPIVRDYCAELGVPYTETTLPKSWAIVVNYIHRVGLGEADPFDCPAAAYFRLA
ncbi:MAG TPA: acyl-CoA desaturase [Amnibacterium sp.]|nr:acyl-CoA desaturase [Amnibacterium sp.]